MNAADLDRLARRVARRLDRGGLSPHQERRLSEARGRALDRFADGRDWRRWWQRLAVPALPAALAAVLLAVLLLPDAGNDLPPQSVAEAQPFRLDYGLLVDDLPIDAYLDEGFRQWLDTRADS
ncbi:MAG: DUF3619 family protein [Rhodocyclaceae bacterium]|nr:DUF3619 family protein [Rhodocyclaceae bacterium]